MNDSHKEWISSRGPARSWTDEARAIKTMARRLGVDRLAQANNASIKRTIARWESDAPTATVPDERYQWVLAHLFADCDGHFDVGPGSDFLCLLNALLSMEISPARVTELQDVVISWAERRSHLLQMRFDHLTLDATSTAKMAMSFTAVSRRVGKVPFARSQLALTPFLATLGRVRQTDEAPPDIHTLATRTFALAGRLAFELHDDEQARRHYATALTHANRLPDSSLTASTCTSLAMIAMHRGDELAVAEKMANKAVQAALAGSSITMRARAFAVQAEVAARRSLIRPAEAALRFARTYATQASVDDPAGTSFDTARLSGFAGLYHLLIGQSAEAVEHLNHAVAGVTEGTDPVQRSILLADLAHGHVMRARPEPEAAVAMLHRCTELVGRTRGRVAMGRLRTVRQSLRAWDGEPFLADFDDYLYTTLFD